MRDSQQQRADRTDAMPDTTVSPVPGADVVPVDPNPEHFRTVRAALVVQGVLLLALGGWGLAAALGDRHPAPSGAPVLVFHLTWAHAVLLLLTGVLSLVGAFRRRWGFWFALAEATGYIMLFMGSAGSDAWISDRADDMLHLALGVIGLALLVWVSARGVEGWYWVRSRRPSQSDGAGSDR